MSAFIDISNQRFGRLVAIKPIKSIRNGKHGTRIIWECRCDCGNIINVPRTSLGIHTNSCGCIRQETTRNRGKMNKGSGLPFGVASKNKLFDKYKRAAAARGLDFLLSMEQFEIITKQTCYYCGIEPKQIAQEKLSNGYYIYNGIDRVDNTRGYILDNVVPCCGTCNRAKRTMTSDEFADWIWRVYRNFVAPRPVFIEMKELGIPR